MCITLPDAYSTGTSSTAQPCILAHLPGCPTLPVAASEPASSLAAFDATVPAGQFVALATQMLLTLAPELRLRTALCWARLHRCQLTCQPSLLRQCQACPLLLLLPLPSRWSWACPLKSWAAPQGPQHPAAAQCNGDQGATNVG